eukprot:647824-Hanusia_phi.AAC.2
MSCKCGDGRRHQCYGGVCVISEHAVLRPSLGLPPAGMACRQQEQGRIYGDGTSKRLCSRPSR